MVRPLILRGASRIRPHFAGNARRAGILQRLLGAHWGELHGLYEPREGAPAQISVWMRTARQKRVVAFRSFLRTLLHELCHHFDYELFRLPETFHTGGFYKRESHLLHQVLGEGEGKEEDQ